MTMRAEQSEGSDLRRWSRGLMVAGISGLALGAVFSWERVWGNLLLAATFLAGVGLGVCFFLALQGVTGARWSHPFLPAARKLAGTLPLLAVASGLVVLAGLYVYPWARGDMPHGATFWFKNAWLSPALFIARSGIYVIIWVAIGGAMSSAGWRGQTGRSALALVLLALSVALAGFDWIMSLEPLWFSTLFGVYQFAGFFLSGLAGLVVLCAWLRRTDAGCDAVEEQQLHDLGKLLFGFSCFWMYIWFSQYMLIWYVNIPEESIYFVRRTEGLWWPLMLLNLALNWVIPFFTLLPRSAKRNWRVMVRVSLVVLIGRWLDLYLMILPPLSGSQPVSGLPEWGALLLTLGVTLGLLTRATQRVVGGRASLRHEPIAVG